MTFALWTSAEPPEEPREFAPTATVFRKVLKRPDFTVILVAALLCETVKILISLVYFLLC
jgi:hypothetical protein